MEIDASLAVGIFIVGGALGALVGVWIADNRIDRRDTRDAMAQPFGDVPAAPAGKRGERGARHLRP